MKTNLVLTGFMGTGKTTVGQLVADHLGLPFIDTDTVIVAAAGQSIPDIFAIQGETGFRQLETEICSWLALGRKQVIATGGGAMINQETRKAFEASSLIVCLVCELEEIARRVSLDNTERPLFKDDQQLRKILEQRLSIYNSFPHRVDTTHHPPTEIAEEIIQLWHKI